MPEKRIVTESQDANPDKRTPPLPLARRRKNAGA
jgi:hypothetical protein